MAADYPIPVGPVEVSEEIKKSRFITFIAHTPTVPAAKAWIDDIRAQHPGARHHCWAFVAGAPQDSQVYGFSDDGEPSGTAGKPMLAQLMGAGLGEVAAVVVRYYGGVLLGTGGLVKNGTAGLTLGGTNTFLGPVALNAGGLILASNTALGAGVLNAAGGTTLDASTAVTTFWEAGSGGCCQTMPIRLRSRWRA